MVVGGNGGRELGAGVAGELVQLAQLAGQTVVAAAATDGWGKAKAGLARLLGRGDDQRVQVMERRLEETRAELAGVSGAVLEARQAAQAAVWQARLGDVLEEHPAIAADLRVLVDQVREGLVGGAVTASGHAVAAGGDMSITASAGGVAAGSIQGGVSAGNPTIPGPAGSWPDPGHPGPPARSR